MSVCVEQLVLFAVQPTRDIFNPPIGECECGHIAVSHLDAGGCTGLHRRAGDFRQCACRKTIAEVTDLHWVDLRRRTTVSLHDLRTVLAQRTGHAHRVPGIWDSNGFPCNECAARYRLQAALDNLRVSAAAGHEHIWQGGRCVAGDCPDYCSCIAGGSGGHQRSPGRCPDVPDVATATQPPGGGVR